MHVVVDMYQMRRDGIYGNTLYEFFQRIGECKKDWDLWPNGYDAHLIFTKKSDLMLFKLRFGKYITGEDQ